MNLRKKKSIEKNPTILGFPFKTKGGLQSGKLRTPPNLERYCSYLAIRGAVTTQHITHLFIWPMNTKDAMNHFYIRFSDSSLTYQIPCNVIKHFKTGVKLEERS